MRLLTDENFPLAGVFRLREAGADVVAEEMPGAGDQMVLARANRDGRVILTFDRDFGRLIYQHGAPAPAGIVFFRSAPPGPEEPAEQLLALVATPGLVLEGKMTVLDADRVRQRPFP